MILVPHYFFQHRLDPRVLINESHDLPEIIPEVQDFDTCGSTQSTEAIQCFFLCVPFSLLVIGL
jgi:hypothetical protein